MAEKPEIPGATSLVAAKLKTLGLNSQADLVLHLPLRFEDETEPRRLHPGDWLYIRAQRRHRVDWTATDALTIWLAVHHAPS